MKSYETYNSNETGAYIRFLLWIGNREICPKHDKIWSFGKSYPSDNEKHYGFKKKGLEGFF